MTADTALKKRITALEAELKELRALKERLIRLERNSLFYDAEGGVVSGASLPAYGERTQIGVR